MRRHRIIFIVTMICAICVVVPLRSRADEKPVKVKIPEALYPGIHHFLDLADPDKKIAFDPKMVAGVLDFVEGPKNAAALHYADGIRGFSSAYHDFDVHENLKDIVSYSFNPDIPCIATMPSSVRLFHWFDAQGNPRTAPRVGQYLDKLDAPVVEKNFQYVEITPDLTSGAYYGYNLYHTLLLFKYRQRNVLVTVSKQSDVSTVGKRGYVLGEDNDWDYFYSDKNGLTIPALGWVRSYMYDSSAILIYDEIDPGAPRVRCAMFKWLRAGWSGINMVKKEHIYRGLKRFAQPFKEIMEYPSLPPVEALAGDFARIGSFSIDKLRSKMEIYSKILKKRYDGGNQNPPRWPSNLLEDKNHWQQMSKEEMESALVVEYMKYAVGKTRQDEVQDLLELIH